MATAGAVVGSLALGDDAAGAVVHSLALGDDAAGAVVHSLALGDDRVRVGAFVCVICPGKFEEAHRSTRACRGTAYKLAYM